MTQEPKQNILPTLSRLTNAVSKMLTGIEVHNSSSKDCPARLEDIAGPVVQELRNAHHAARMAIEAQAEAQASKAASVAYATIVKVGMYGYALNGPEEGELCKISPTGAYRVLSSGIEHSILDAPEGEVYFKSAPTPQPEQEPPHE